MQVASLGSGSRGNATLIEEDDTCLLVDLGFSVKETIERLERLNRDPSDINEILVTHEHADHINGVAAFAATFDIPIRMTPGTAYTRRTEIDGAKRGLNVERLNCHKPFLVGCITVEPVPVPHDAREPCQFVFAGATDRIGLLTDTGHITPIVEQHYRQCDVLLLECNYDTEMLATGPYPHRLKQRVGGVQGHLSNEQAAGLLRKVDTDRLQHLVISHISEKNNLPSLASAAVMEALGSWRGNIHVSHQVDGVGWIIAGDT